MPDIAALNAQFGIPDTVTFCCGPGELATVDIRHSHANARLVLQGAQLLAWTPDGEEPVIWLSEAARYAEGQAIRGGIPICWPWFGAHRSSPTFPAHGFARTSPWIVEDTRSSEAAVALRLRLLQSEASETLWPHACSLTLELRVGRCLELDLATRNLGARPVTITEALHAYFHVADLPAVRIHGLDGTNYIDKTDAERRKHQNGTLAFEAETDRVYTGVTGECVIEDPGFRRRIRIRKRGSASTIVWNPGAEKSARLDDMEPDGYRRMVCVESGNAGADAVTIQPGEVHRLGVSYATERLG